MNFSKYLFPILMFLYACFAETGSSKDNGDTINLLVDSGQSFQEMDHFGASDAWSAQFVGNWPEPKRNAIADLLFSMQMDDSGNPLGIGLSLWRINLGAGSAGQGEASGIRDRWRRAPSYLDPTGRFDLDRQKGQTWFARAAKERGVQHLLLFVNSPPVWLTRNGKSFADDGTQSNLAAEKQAEFAEYMVASLVGLQQAGLSIDYISPVNEPQWDWKDGGQEGSPFWNHEIAAIVRKLEAGIYRHALDTKIDIAEAGQIDYLFSEHNRPGRANQIRVFFHKESEHYLGNLAHVSRAISGHSYFTTSPFHQAVAKREQLAQAITQVEGLKYWMSEYCILGDNAGEISGSGRDLGIDAALYMAKVIHNDLVVAQASAWHWWLAISPYDYKDGLVYISKSETDGEFAPSKMLWGLGNYSRFIRPGFRRISISPSNQKLTNKDVLVSAYKDPRSDELVVVLVNSSSEEQQVNILVDGELSGSAWCGYLTDRHHNLAYHEMLAGEPIRIPARSILTLKK
nr:xylanase [Cytophagales bacterium]